MGAIISLAYMMTKIGEYFYPKESAPPDPEKGPQNIIVNIGEYNCHFDYKLMEGQMKISTKEEEKKYIEENKYIEDAVYDLENNLAHTI